MFKVIILMYDMFHFYGNTIEQLNTRGEQLNKLGSACTKHSSIKGIWCATELLACNGPGR